MAKRKRLRHPVQPVEWDDHGVLRFKENPIVSYLLDNSRADLDALHLMSDKEGFTTHDWDQFNQLIGYSVSGCPIRSRVTRSIADEKAEAYMREFPAPHKNPNSEDEEYVDELISAAFDDGMEERQEWSGKTETLRTSLLSYIAAQRAKKETNDR